jgi:hypothetical protein
MQFSEVPSDARGNGAAEPVAIERGLMKSILDRTFRYTPSFNTDLKKTFARVQRERRTELEKSERADAPVLASVSSIVRKPPLAK